MSLFPGPTLRITPNPAYLWSRHIKTLAQVLTELFLSSHYYRSTVYIYNDAIIVFSGKGPKVQTIRSEKQCFLVFDGLKFGTLPENAVLLTLCISKSKTFPFFKILSTSSSPGVHWFLPS